MSDFHPESNAEFAEKFIGPGTGNFLADAAHLHAVMREFDWYALAGTPAERLLHSRLSRLVSCDEFGEMLNVANSTTGGKE